MGFIKRFRSNHEDMFVFLDAKEVHHHDHFMAKTILRLFPRAVTPNKVTLFRIFATPFVFLLVIMGYYVVGAVAFLLLAFTDVMDGSIARTRNQVTEFGMLFDPLADKFLIGAMILALISNYNFWLIIAVLGLEIAFVGIATIAKVKFKTVRMANNWGKTKMLLQVVAVFFTVAALMLNTPGLLIYGAWAFGLAIGFAIVSLFSHGI